MSIQAQADEVDKVKRSENGVITDPFFLSPSHTLQDAEDLMRKFRISGVPICENNKLVGIITNRDLKFETDFSKKISESMTSEGLITAPEGITLEDAKAMLTEVIGGIKMRGKAVKGEKTMLDALEPALDALTKGMENGDDAEACLNAMCEAAREGVEFTKTIRATKGRASYLGDRSIGHQDPGATSATITLEAIRDFYLENK